MPVYRYYRSPLSNPAISEYVPGAIVVGSNSAVSYQDVTADAGFKADLDEYMTSIGWTYLSTAPAISTAVQVAQDGLLLANAVPLQGLDTPGSVARDLVKIDALNDIVLGDGTYRARVFGNVVSVQTPDAALTATAARVIIEPGYGGDSDDVSPGGASGKFEVVVGQGGLAGVGQPAGAGGLVHLEAGLGGDGSATGAAGAGGDIELVAGAAGADNGGGGALGGNVTIDAGQDSAGATGGTVNIGTGNASLLGLGRAASVTSFGGGAKVQRRETAGNLTCDTAGIFDYIICVTNTAAPRTITLPAASADRVIVVKDQSGGAGANNITVVPAAGTIDGAANFVIATNYGAQGFYSDGVNWFTL